MRTRRAPTPKRQLTPDERAAILHQIKIEREIERRECELSLAAFVKAAWHIIEPGTPLLWNWHLDTVCGYLEAVKEGLITRLIINIPPGSLKSILLVMYQAWEWIDRPEERFLAIANEQGLSIRDALRIKQIITSDWYQKFWPLALQADQNEKTLFSNEKRGFRQSQGITASNTGKRGSRLIIDDPIDMKHVYSDVIRKGVNETYDQTLSTRVNDPEKSPIILIMQRGHENDLAGHLLSKSETQWVHLSIPMEYEGAPTFDAGKDIGRPELNDPRTKKGELLFPKRFTLKAVKALKEDLGEYGAAAQLQQRPVPTGGGIIKSHWWRLWPDDMPLPAMEHIFLSYDTAFSEKDMKDSAFSAMTRWGVFWHEQRQRYCLMCLGRWYDRVGYDELRTNAKDWDKKHEPDAHLIEKKATGISLVQDLRRALPGKVRSYTPGRGEDKVSRAYSVSPMFQAGLVYAPNKQWATSTDEKKPGLIKIVSSFPNGAPPCADLTDTVTQACLYLRNGYWVSHPDDDDPDDNPEPLHDEDEEEDEPSSAY
jgi:predicted phage terminase large subunit-like protein